MTLRLIGALVICLGSSCLGFSAAGSVKRSAKTLRQLKQALEMMRCEVSYTLTPIARICEIICSSSEGEVRCLFEKLTDVYSRPLPENEDWAKKLTASCLKSIPAQPQDAMTELISSFGRFGAAEQLRLIDLTLEKLCAAAEQQEAEKQQRCRCYQSLGICTGLAVAILVL